MKHLLFLLQVLADESRKRYFILKSFVFALLYISLAMLAINYKSYASFALSDYNLLAKIKIIFIIFIGSFQAMDVRDVVLLSITALLFGVNLELVLRKIKFLASMGNLHVTVGTGLITLVATGCASCGLSIASIVGLTGALAALPFHGLELYVVSIIILTASLFYNLDTLVKACKIKR